MVNIRPLRANRNRHFLTRAKIDQQQVFVDADTPRRHSVARSATRRLTVKFLTTRELRNTPGALEKALREGEVALTAKGKPIGIVVPVHGDDFDDVTRSIRRARATIAVEHIRERAAQGPADLDIGAEIAAARGERRARS
jgi:hypothetical protein